MVYLINGKIVSADQAGIPIDDIEFSYGFGVYENLRVRKKKIVWPEDHVKRLMQSAKSIGLDHEFSEKTVLSWLETAAKAETEETFNLKIVLVGGKTKTGAKLYIFSGNPAFLSAAERRDGVDVVTYPLERWTPTAKTLNMLPSYLAYRKAKQQNANDALLANGKGIVREGTKSNLFGIQNGTIISPPAEKILPGVTRKHVLELAEKNGIKITEREFTAAELLKMDAAFLTNTSCGVLPIRSIDGHKMRFPFPKTIAMLQKLFKAAESEA